MNGQRKDIVFLVADLDMEYTIRGLMARPEALGTRSNITFDVFRHPQRDPGVFRHADAWLRTRCRNYEYALTLSHASMMSNPIDASVTEFPCAWVTTSISFSP